MKQLSYEAFGRARHFLKTQARPLDRALRSLPCCTTMPHSSRRIGWMT